MFCLVLSGLASAQRDAKPPKKVDDSWKEDPYTKDDPNALTKSGYVRMGSTGWNGQYGSDRIDQAVGDVKLRWIETEHFRLGCALKKWKVPGHDKDVKKRIRAELTRLKKRFPKIKPKAKELDPWLRAHLYAQRLEELYAEMCDVLCVTQEMLPDMSGKPVDGKDMGNGPHLGSRRKFGVLLFHKDSSCKRYQTTFTGSPGTGPARWYHSENNSDMFVFSTAATFLEDVYVDDTSLYCSVTFNILQNMLESYRGFASRGPIWWQEGLLHSMRREVSEDFNNFTNVSDRTERIFRITDWAPRVAQSIKFKLVRPLSEIAPLTEFKDVKFQHHLELWSRMEFLRTLGKEKLAKFIFEMKGCKGTYGNSAPIEKLLKAQERAMREAWGFESYDDLDAAWMKWAKKEYRGMKMKKQ